ncbi:hypothetical protein NQZ68_027468 [Dissostichus eleginoides]|nr:hypothetical protein NQZ68_027468 [Dissostichus eleginoides]
MSTVVQPKEENGKIIMQATQQRGCDNSHAICFYRGIFINVLARQQTKQASLTVSPQTHLVQPAPSLSTTEDPAVLQLQHPGTSLGWPNEGDPAGRLLPPSNTDEPEVIQRRLFTIQWQQSKEVDRYPELNIHWQKREQSLLRTVRTANCRR